MVEKTSSPKRVRGVILSTSGWQRLQTAKKYSEVQTNGGNPYTLDEMAALVHLSHSTLTKVHQRKVPIDRQTLDIYFNALGLTLQPSDYTRCFSEQSIREQSGVESELPTLLMNPKGPVPLGSPFYVGCPLIERECEQAILQPGALIRIRAPQYMGKTSLMIRLLNQVRQYEMESLALSFRLADASVLRDLDSFLNWFCRIVTRSLDRPDQLDDYWNNLFGSNYSCTDYFEKYLLANSDRPIVLALDDLDQLFPYPEIATHFFGLLRAWYEKARYGDRSSSIWQKLRLIVVHSTEVYMPLNQDQSPFNVGVSVKLPDLTCEQVVYLAHQYGLHWKKTNAQLLVDLVGGNPYLVQLALGLMQQQQLTFEQFAATAIAPSSIYNKHLRQQLSYLQQYPDLIAALTQVMTSNVPVDLESVQAFKLQSMGLVRIHNHCVAPSCQLYRQYFNTALPCLSVLPEALPVQVS